nr:unnamed protein product [Callosobruchus chinensis]
MQSTEGQFDSSLTWP